MADTNNNDTPRHTYGAKCRLAPVPRVKREDDMPPIESQFFYSSIIPIDDPLSTTSAPGTSESRANKGQLRPFSWGDNNALEKAWLGLMSDGYRKAHQDARRGHALDSRSSQAVANKLAFIVQELAAKHWEKHRSKYKPQDLSISTYDALPTTPLPPCCPELAVDVSEELEGTICALLRTRIPASGVDQVVNQVVLSLSRLREEAGDSSASRPSTADAPLNRSRATSITTAPSHPISRIPKPTEFRRRSSRGQATPPTTAGVDMRSRIRSSSQPGVQPPRTPTPIGSPAFHRLPGPDDGISGKPFVRVGTPEAQPEASSASTPRESPLPNVMEGKDETDTPTGSTQEPKAAEKTDETNHSKQKPKTTEIAVGISRLHMVSLPTLQMKPIYWSPVNDVAVVMRATWFYRDTMLPIPAVVANRLEAGFQELRPWTETWSDEIRCAIDVGPLGEEKVSYRLWPKNSELCPVNDDGVAENTISSDPFCAARCFRGEAAAEGCIESAPNRKVTTETAATPFSNYHVIYKNSTEAYMLKPSLRPSAYYGRRPVWKIMKGLTVGVPVVRGFDRNRWEQKHQQKKTMPSKPGISAADQSHESTGQGVCSACKAEKDRGQVTDLVLVAHGIGQKFAERVESFHFTHAINAFRRSVNIEMQSPIVQDVLREDQKGMMILPLNWRMGLSFEDGGPMKEEDKDYYHPEAFGLKDVEPDTIPAVRSVISDVMFDIPFYMSHHKGKMIKALVSEANRVYRLWCRNNKGFAENGRVHLIGHSLGSAMALEILSRQPTTVPKHDLTGLELETRFFEFNTTNLFLAGSPAAFFLLLERGVLIPRHGKMKPGADSSDTIAPGVVGQVGTFGCLAVENIYNVLAKEDPIAYLLNGAVDPNYAASLKPAYVPSIAGSLWKSVGDAMRSVVPGMPPPSHEFALEPERPPTLRLPSQMELDVHDFTREEIAEKKAFLLNDNGQIDWYLRSGGGPLEIQYLNMLSAHSSYWTNVDFIRMLCIEIGRRPGRAYTLPAMRAVKATKRLIV
ncbi:DDHD domain-containing protein [Mariannaea sp. PMI_226]|nr:DDHD domain-containing protein [Mariannaea sp. PMI_226]